jgi:uncharacterized protein (TIGR03435 family)
MNPIDASLRAVLIGAVAATIVAIAKCRSRPLAPQFEHALWTCILVAMLGFAVPKITVHAGSPMTPAHASAAAVSFQQSDLAAMSIPNPAHIAPASAARANIWLIIWLAGTGLMALRIVLGLFLTHRSLADARTIARENAIPNDVTGISRLQESDNAIVPMTIGWPRTRIVLPTSWRTWPNDKLRAVLLHELAHVRRRDALVTFLAAINKAIFWFHPLAWWLERRLAELAEFAADDAAVKASIDPRDYASILLDIASGARPTRLRLSSDFARHGLHRINRRIERIFDSRARTGSMRIVWTAATLIAAITLIQFQRPIHAQEPSGLTFDTASVKLAKVPKGVSVSGRGMTISKGLAVTVPRNTGGPGTDDPGRIHYPLISLKELLTRAWDSYFEIQSPDWLDSQTVAVDATMPSDTTKAQFREMLRNLIAIRFGLKYHVEAKEVAGYSLELAKNGPKMNESPNQNSSAMEPGVQPTSRDADGFPIFPPRAGPWCVLLEIPGDRHRMMCQQQTMQDLAKLLAAAKSTVTDATGLTAKYDFTLTYSGERPGSAPVVSQTPVAQPEDSPLPDIFSALQSQLGLKLEPKKVPVEVMVVDHMEKTPTGN